MEQKKWGAIPALVFAIFLRSGPNHEQKALGTDRPTEQTGCDTPSSVLAPSSDALCS